MILLYNILICNDDRDIVSALDIYLTSDRYKTYHAYDGLEALKIVEEREIHLILMDVMMPHMDGSAPPPSSGRARIS